MSGYVLLCFCVPLGRMKWKLMFSMHAGGVEVCACMTTKRNSSSVVSCSLIDLFSLDLYPYWAFWVMPVGISDA